jgi:hypothetical protein
MICIVAKVIYDGTKQGVFEVSDVVLAAMFAITAKRRFFNPLMIAQSAHKPEPALDQMIDSSHSCHARERTQRYANVTHRARSRKQGQKLWLIGDPIHSVRPST